MTIRSIALALSMATVLGCGENDAPFGALTLSGLDTAEVGATFAPVSVSNQIIRKTDFVVTWSLGRSSPEALVVVLEYPDGAVSDVFVNLPARNGWQVYEWGTFRQPEQAEADWEGRSVTFHDYPISDHRGGTGPISLNGTLTW